jgi:hypothetical protein
MLARLLGAGPARSRAIVCGTDHRPAGVEGLGLAPFAHCPLQAPPGEGEDRWTELRVSLGEGVRRRASRRRERDLRGESLLFEVFQPGEQPGAEAAQADL